MTVAKTDHLDCFKTRTCDMNVVRIHNSSFTDIMTYDKSILFDIDLMYVNLSSTIHFDQLRT